MAQLTAPHHAPSTERLVRIAAILAIIVFSGVIVIGVLSATSKTVETGRQAIQTKQTADHERSMTPSAALEAVRGKYEKDIAKTVPNYYKQIDLRQLDLDMNDGVNDPERLARYHTYLANMQNGGSTVYFFQTELFSFCSREDFAVVRVGDNWALDARGYRSPELK